MYVEELIMLCVELTTPCKKSIVSQTSIHMYAIWTILGYRVPRCLIRQHLVFGTV